MRTKTLLLSALLGTVGSISAMSQSVYSINSVGYITVDCAPGFTMVADQLMAQGGNALSNIANDASGAYDSLGVFKWTGGSYVSDQGDSAASSFADGWDNDGVLTLNPGEGAWFVNENPPGGAHITITFVGTVPQGTNSVNLTKGFNMISSPAPIGGDLVTAAGLTNFNDGDAVYVWIPSIANYQGYTADFSSGCCGYNGNWDSPGDPQVPVGSAMWYISQANFTFAQVFSVNQ